MLKHLYQTLKISILCGSILTFQTSVAIAAGTNSTDRSGVITNTQNHSFSKIDDTDMLTSLSMLAGGFIASRMITAYTPATLDVKIAGAAGAIFIAGEVYSNVKFKGTIDEMTIEVQKKSDGTVNEEQIQRLKDLKVSYEEAKETTQTKKTLQLAAAVGFTAAAATAIYLDMTEQGQIASCKASLASGVTQLSACVSAGAVASATVVAAAEGKACSACIAEFGTYGTTVTNYVGIRSVPNLSKIKDKETVVLEGKLSMPPCRLFTPGATAAKITASVNSVCKPAVLTMIKNQADGKVLVSSNANKLINKLLKDPVYAQAFENKIQPQRQNYVESALNLFFPRAEAGWLPLLGLSAGVAAVFIPATAAVATEVDLMMYVPRNRAIAFGAFAATSYLASRSSENVIEKINANIEKIDGILAELGSMANGIKAQNIQKQQVAIQKASPSQAVASFSTSGTAASDCLASNSTTNCTSVTDTLASMPGFANLPDSFKNVASQVTKVGDSLSGKTGISGSTLSSAEALASKQNAVAKLLANKQAAMEKLSDGKLNFAKEEKNFFNRLNEKNKKALQRGGMTATGMMSKIGATPINSNAAPADKDALAQKSATGASVIDISAGAGHSDKDKSLDLDFKDNAGANVAADASGVQEKPAEYDIDSSEINGRNGPSLFEVISSRYIKSGYPKLLEEEKVKN